jgi:hypothetical protein
MGSLAEWSRESSFKITFDFDSGRCCLRLSVLKKKLLSKTVTVVIFPLSHTLSLCAIWLSVDGGSGLVEINTHIESALHSITSIFFSFLRFFYCFMVNLCHKEIARE